MMIYVLIVAAILVLDIVTKTLAHQMIPLNSSKTVIENIFYLARTKNTGAAYGLGSESTGLLIVISSILVLVVVFLIYKFDKKTEKIAFSLILGGALGNLLERIFYGSVTDFLFIKPLGRIFPNFNIADMAIFSGCVLAVIYVFFIDKEKEVKKGLPVLEAGKQEDAVSVVDLTESNVEDKVDLSVPDAEKAEVADLTEMDLTKAKEGADHTDGA